MGAPVSESVYRAVTVVDAPLERFLDAPAPPPLRRRPLKALRHFRRLVADKEDTAEVFHIMLALNGNNYEHVWRDFLADPQGRARLAQARNLPDVLDDHDRWLALPEGTLGRAYVDFMRAEGITARGLVEEALKPDDGVIMMSIDPARRWFYNRSRDTHDLYHVLTGIGRDALGEAILLNFTYSQHGGLGNKFIAVLGAREAARGLPKGAPWIKALRQAGRLGRTCAHIDRQDLIALFDHPLEDVRAQLNLGEPTYYHRCHEMCRAAGIDPYDLVASTD